MAHPPSILVSKKGPKYADPWHERYNQPSFHVPVPHVMRNIAEGGPQNPTLKLPNHRADPNNISLKSNASHERKCQVYVHHFSKIPTRSNTYMQNNWQSGSQVHQNMYKHEVSDFCDAKMRTLRRQFDNLSLNSKRPPSSSPNRLPKLHNALNKYFNQEKINFYNQVSKIPQIKSNSNSKEISKSLLFKAEHKSAFDKLEESYWAKWKPNKAPPNKESQPKLKGLYTENEKIETTYQITTRSGRKERGDSNETVRHVASLEKNLSETSNTDAVDANLFYVVTEPDEAQQGPSAIEQPKLLLVEHITDLPLDDELKKLDKKASTVVVVPPIQPTQEEESGCNVNLLKHTDSFILTAKKQSKEKPHFQQPKCIKLFKNVGYTTTATVNHVKGGSYPLKSCMRRKSPGTKPCNLGRPGSPVRGSTMRRPGKANRFT